MRAPRSAVLFLALLLGPGLLGAGAVHASASGAVGAAGAGPSVTDYADPAHWLTAPTVTPYPVDVFYLVGTTYVKAGPSAPVIGPVDDPAMIARSQSAFQRTATAFAPFANIFAPYYRQADAATRLHMPWDQGEALEAGEPTADALASFDTFIRRFNHGRPFILAGHSQGANLLANVLAQYMPTHPDVYRRMVAAYIVGYSITPAYLARNPLLRFAQGPDDTGVIVSWNTEAQVLAYPNPVTQPNGIAINPITWTRSETAVPAARNLGSIEVDRSTGLPVRDATGRVKRVLGLADARVDKARGVVICSSVDPVAFSLPPFVGVYHTYDYPFYYFDIQWNAANRAVHWLLNRVLRP